MSGRLANKVALISGGARGQGAAEARAFAREGAMVMIGDILDAEADQIAAEIEAAGGAALSVYLDVTEEADWREAVAATVRGFGKLNILVNNAGILRMEGLEETTLEIWDDDGSQEWEELYQRVQQGPVREQRDTATGGGMGF